MLGRLTYAADKQLNKNYVVIIVRDFSFVVCFIFFQRTMFKLCNNQLNCRPTPTSNLAKSIQFQFGGYNNILVHSQFDFLLHLYFLFDPLKAWRWITQPICIRSFSNFAWINLWPVRLNMFHKMLKVLFQKQI